MEALSNCRVCGASKPENFKIWYDGALKVFRCRLCGYVGLYAGPGMATAGLQYSEAYRVDWLDRGPFMYPERETALRDIAARAWRAAPSGRLLDVGCGDGHFLSLCKDVWQCEGIEPCSVLAERASLVSSVAVRVGNYGASAYAPKTFDVITFVQVLEHLEQPLEALQAARNHLKPGGLLVVEVPSLNAPHIIAYRITHLKRLVAPPNAVIRSHLSYFGPASLLALARSAGFHEVKLVTGRWSVKYSGWKRSIGRIIDPALDRARIGGMLLFAKRR